MSDTQALMCGIGFPLFLIMVALAINAL